MAETLQPAFLEHNCSSAVALRNTRSSRRSWGSLAGRHLTLKRSIADIISTMPPTSGHAGIWVLDPLSCNDLTRHLGEVIMQGSGCKATSRDSAVLDASTHFGAFHETDKGQMPRVPVQLEAFSKPCKLKVRSCPTVAGDVRVRELSKLGFLVDVEWLCNKRVLLSLCNVKGEY